MRQLEKVLYTAATHTSGGREGAARSTDGRLEVKLSRPGAAGGGTNPEQLFAAGWSACFLSSMEVAAAQRKVSLPADRAVDAEMDLGPSGDIYLVRARLKVSLPGIERKLAQDLLEAAERICPYSNAVRGNIEVEVSLA